MEANHFIQNELAILPYEGKILTAVYENNRLAEFLVEEKEPILGNVYVGKVENIVRNINTAFVRFTDQWVGSYSLKENTTHFFLNAKKGSKLVQGDEILVQVQREPIKTKPAMLTGKITLTGKNLVLTVHTGTAAVSSKITSKEERARLKEIIQPYITDEYGFIVRTYAQGQPAENLQQEANKLIKRFESILKKSASATCFSKVYSGMSAYSRYIIGHPQLERVTTEIPEIYEQLKELLQDFDLSVPLSLYHDEDWPLARLKGIKTQIERALNPHVWLKSGGFLVIQPTEAMTVIDVNSGRYTGKKDSEEMYFKINMEAAEEIARQLRLRNLSGIIIIDFIDMKAADKRSALMHELHRQLQKDSIKTSLVDITKLNLVELTRKKERKPLHEIFEKSCPTCNGTGRIPLQGA